MTHKQGVKMKFIAVRINPDTRKNGNYSRYPKDDEYDDIWRKSSQNGFHECVNFKSKRGIIKGYLPPNSAGSLDKCVPDEPFGIIFLTLGGKTKERNDNMYNKIVGIQINCKKIRQSKKRSDVPNGLKRYLGNDALCYHYTALGVNSLLLSNPIGNASELVRPAAREKNKDVWKRGAIKLIDENNIFRVLNVIEGNLTKQERLKWKEMMVGVQYDISLESIQEDFDKSVRKILKSKKMNLNPQGNEHPQKRILRTQIYVRNPEIVAAVLKRANKRCECCNAKAPFKRKKDGSPYLEVHHKKQLKDGGADTMDNAIALCPNCHRKMHFG